MDVMTDEAKLLYKALSFEEGHSRRTQHILKVYALAKMLGEIEKLSSEEQVILNAAAILHDIPIKYCKEHYAGDACQENQRNEAPALVNKFLTEAKYQSSYYPQVLELVQKHHDYGCEKSKLLQLLMEADLIVNCYEYPPTQERVAEIKTVFVTAAGKQLLDLCVGN